MHNFVIFENTSSSCTRFQMGWLSISNKYHTIYYKSNNITNYLCGDKTILVIGDYWTEFDLRGLTLEPFDFQTLLQKLKGTYYFFVIEAYSISVFTGFLGLCPLYYSKKFKFVTSCYSLITNLENTYIVSEKFILESFLFNHAFSNDTVYCDIEQLEAHVVLIINCNSDLSKYTFFNSSTLFVNKPTSIKDSYKSLVDKFIETVDVYVPDTGSALSFTGGFDGRTIVSASLSLNKSFNIFSFGRKENDDVRIPIRNAKELGLNYEHIDPDNEYIINHYIECSKELSLHNGGFNGFLYGHFLYMARKLSLNYQTLITGYGGSELLRATHIQGAVTSKALYDIITIENRKELKLRLLKNESLAFLKQSLVRNNIDELLEDIFTFKEKVVMLKTSNEKITAYILNNTIRKIFGSWQFSQSKYINVRSPFLDFNFVNSLYKTDFAGVYNDFYTENPVKRFNGQLLYALIIKATNNTILKQKTGKGYSPNQLLSPVGKISLVYPFLLKRIKRKIQTENLDNLGLLACIKHLMLQNKNKNWSKYFENEVIFKYSNELSQYRSERQRDALLNYYSLSSILNNV